MQCVRCGRVTNLEDRRCPQCGASLANQAISQREVLGWQLREAADLTAQDMRRPFALRCIATGAAIGALVMAISISPAVIACAAASGGIAGWLAGWRRWGRMRTCAVFAMLMIAPVALWAPFMPFAMLAMAVGGMAIGVIIELNQM
jgi:hypothetical protein